MVDFDKDVFYHSEWSCDGVVCVTPWNIYSYKLMFLFMLLFDYMVYLNDLRYDLS